MPKGVYERNQNRAAWNAERGLPPPRSHHARGTPSSHSSAHAANNNGGGGSNGMASSSSSSSSMLHDRPTQSTFNTLKFEYDPANPTNVRRSLYRNDVELAALSKLHKSMSALRATIAREYGDAAFVTAISSRSSAAAAATTTNTIHDENESDGARDDEEGRRPTTSKFDRLIRALAVRTALRRRLLNRLARRLHRVSHAMDTFVSSHAAPSNLAITAPIPPGHGDVVRRYVTSEAEANGIASRLLGGSLDDVRVVREVDVEEYSTRLEEIDTMKEILDECARTHNYNLVDNYNNNEEEEEVKEEEENEEQQEDTSSPPTPILMSEVDSILHKEMKCQPLYTKLAEYELSNGYYDKVYHISPSSGEGNDGNEKKGTGTIVKAITPLINTMDDHEVDDDGNFIITATTTNKKGEQSNNTQQHHRLPFLHIGAIVPAVRSIPPKERVNEWKRWTKEMCDRISDQITFSELIMMGGEGCGGDGGVGGPPGHVFNLEERKRKSDDDDAVVVTNGGKVPRVDNDSMVVVVNEDVSMGNTEDKMDTKVDDAAAAATKEEINANDKKGQDTALTTTTTLPTKSFSVMPVPSFYYQDLKRIRNIHSEMVRSLQSHNSRGRIIRAQLEYDAAYKKSIDLQHAKVKQQKDYQDLIKWYKDKESMIMNESYYELTESKKHWVTRQYQNADAEETFGMEQALNRNVCNDIIQDIKDRVCIRLSTGMQPSGLGSRLLINETRMAESAGDLNRLVSATTLGHMIDSVERRHKDMLANHTEYITPTLPTVDNIVYKLDTGETVAQYYTRKGNAMRKGMEELEAAFKIAETKRGEQWAVLTKAKGGSAAVSGSKSNTSRRSVPSSGGGGYGAVVAPNRQSFPMQQMQPRQAPGHVPQSYYQASPATQMQSQISPATQLMMQQQAQMARMQQTMIQQQQQQQQFQAQASTFPVSQISSVQIPSSISVAMDQSFVPVSSTVDAPNQMTIDESVIAQDALAMQPQQHGASGEVKPAHRYEYGDRYSEQNVRARKNPDGTVLPATAPKLLPDGTFAKPSGRQRKGMEWDAIKGCWYPLPGGGSSGSYSGSEN